ncbi:MAG TPA: DinB family protein [Thermomicrobiales bacterium]|nr:DinB family protein [Thermomicrobiales bacterium]
MATTDRRHIVLEPPAGTGNAGLWVAALDDTRRRTLEMLDGLDPAWVDAPAAPLQHTIGTLLYHVALIEADWLYVEIREEDYPDDVVALLPWEDRDARGRLTHVTGVTLEAHLERLAAVRERLRATLLAMGDEKFAAAREIPDATVSTAWVVNHLMQHEAEHRGEMGQILATIARSASS